MRASIATAGNDHRLGANEAPPAIMSVFVGDTLEHVLNDFENNQTSAKGADNKGGAIQVPNIPEILIDNTDRNRTSPFAFTGNKFEFRAVGSSDNCASPMVVLNTIVADQLVKFKTKVDAKIKASKGVAKEEIIKQVLREELTSSKRILFGGNGYGDEWVKEAKKRGLNNVKNTAEALAFYMSPSSVDVFVKNGIYSHKELEARTEIRYESFNLRIQIEGRVLNELVQNFVIPAGIKYQKRLADNVQILLAIGQSKSSVKAQMDIITELSNHINKAFELNNQMTNERAKANKLADAHAKALVYNKKVKGLFDEIRESCDEIERLVDDADWVLPKYRELLSLS